MSAESMPDGSVTAEGDPSSPAPPVTGQPSTVLSAGGPRFAGRTMDRLRRRTYLLIVRRLPLGVRRELRRELSGRRRGGSGVGTVGVVVVFIAAGLLFATSAETARGTQLRTDRTDLAALIRSENAKRDDRAEQVAALDAEIQRHTQAEAAVNGEVAAVQARSGAVAPAAGLSSITGPGLTVTLNDAPADNRPAQAQPDDLVVHQQDVQAVVNALWAGGAQGLMLMDQRVISTSAVRCVGNTLILQGRVYSPPYRITAVGDPERLRTALDDSPTIPFYLEYVQRYGLGWAVEDHPQLTLPAYGGTLRLDYAQVIPSSPSPSAATTSSGSPAARTTPAGVRR